MRLQLIVVAWLVIAIIWHASCATGTAVHLAGDWVCNVAELLLLLLKVFGCSGRGVLLDPVLGFLNGFLELFS